nr:hypothetical protein [Tanacetum cinerariifolium]
RQHLGGKHPQQRALGAFGFEERHGVVFQRRRKDELGRRGEGIDLGLEAGQHHPEDREENQRRDRPRQGAEQHALQAAGLFERHHDLAL